MENYDPFAVRETLDPEGTLEDLTHAAEHFRRLLIPLMGISSPEQKEALQKQHIFNSAIRTQRDYFTYWYAFTLAAKAIKSFIDGPFAVEPATYVLDASRALRQPEVFDDVQAEWEGEVERFGIVKPLPPHSILRYAWEFLRDLVEPANDSVMLEQRQTLEQEGGVA